MQRKIVLVTAAGFLAANIASAQQIGVNANVNANANANLNVVQVQVQATTTANSNVRGNATSSAKRNDNAAVPTAATTSVAAKDKRSVTAEAHMSTVAKFVQSLLAVADREGGIGAEVRAIAKAQNDTATTTAKAVASIEARGKFRTFLFGSDYKSIGQLRSDMSVTENNITQLKAVLEKTVNANDKAELVAQLKVLEDANAQMSAYIQARESSFSLFGWLNK